MSRLPIMLFALLAACGTTTPETGEYDALPPRESEPPLHPGSARLTLYGERGDVVRSQVLTSRQPLGASLSTTADTVLGLQIMHYLLAARGGQADASYVMPIERTSDTVYTAVEGRFGDGTASLYLQSLGDSTHSEGTRLQDSTVIRVKRGSTVLATLTIYPDPDPPPGLMMQELNCAVLFAQFSAAVALMGNAVQSYPIVNWENLSVGGQAAYGFIQDLNDNDCWAASVSWVEQKLDDLGAWFRPLIPRGNIDWLRAFGG